MTVTATRQDLSRIDGITDDAVCHLFPEFDDFSYCGVPREEQASHGHVDADAETCDKCPLKRCPICRERC